MNDCAVVNKKLADLTPDSRNANKGSPRGNQMIEDSLRQYGAGRSILLDKHGRIIAGNKTAENAGAIGMDDVLVVQSDGTRLVAVQRTDLDLDDPHTRQLAIADNRAGQVSLDWDADALKGLVEDGVDLSPFWTADELANLWPIESGLAAGVDEDAVPEPPAEAITRPGDVILLGRHRLMCGDSTNVQHVEALMGGGSADMVWTDPPYGVSYVGKTKDALTIENDSLDDDGLTDFLRAALGCALAVCRAGGAWYVAAPARPLHQCFSVVLKEFGVWRQTLNWVKSSMVLGRSDYHYRHEPIFYGWKPGAAHTWSSDRTQTTVLEFPKPSRNGEHPTMKPVALVEYCIGNNSKAGQSVLDLFGGSGTTLIACEKTGRTCYMMELAPKYCDVIVTRWEQATGKKAVRDGANG